MRMRSCKGCSRLNRENAELRARLAAEEEENRKLREQLAAAKKDSSTSSKPPSSDIVKPASSTDTEPRAAGGQSGHPMHEREPFSPEEITHFEEHTLEACPCCGGEVRRNGDIARIVQQIEITRPPLTVEQHTSPEYWCAHCRRTFTAPMPSHIEKGGLVGPELLALIAYLKGACHASYSTVRKFLRDVVGVTISRSHLCKLIDKVTAALDASFAELLEALPNEARVNVDETGHKNNGERWWTWCFRAELYTLYRIDAHRNAEVLMETLGKDFGGVLGCDYFSAYRRYMRTCSIQIQFCLAHLIRDVKFLTTLPDARTRQYGEDLREALREMFAVIHRRAEWSATAFASRLAAARERVLKVGLAAPPTRQAQAMAKRFHKHGAAYFAFITTPGMEPTNNLAEQAIRFVVIDRHITQGTRSEGGRRWSERIWTAIATCTQQGKSVFAFLHAAIRAWFVGEPGPSLLASV